ncbi:MAG: AmmeMemoRadiSam system protein B [Candidatus Hydrothermia bacterium]
MIRYPSHAGSFYPASKDEIGELFSKFESATRDIIVSVENPFALVSPHAGYIYSGMVAYATYKNTFLQKIYNTVIILGPSHYVYLSGASIYPEGSWLTPMGEVIIDSDCAKKLLEKSPHFISAPELHRREHSIEVQIPFIQFFQPRAKIVPVLVGDLTDKMIEELGEAISEALSERDDVLIVASSDLYHGESYRACIESDKRTIDAILKRDWKDFLRKAQSGEIMACGEMPISILLSTLEHLRKPVEGKLVMYTNSADVTGLKGGYVVGYSGIIFGV